MNLPNSSTLTFKHPRTQRMLAVHAPTVEQIEAVLALDPEDAAARAAETLAQRIRRTRRQVGVLLAPIRPTGWRLPEWVAWRAQARQARRWARGLEYKHYHFILQTLLIAAQGLDVNRLEELAREAAAQKKSPAPEMKSSPTSASS